MVVVDGDLRNSRRDRSTAGTENEDRQVHKRYESKDEGSLHADQLGISAGRISQEAGVSGGTAGIAEVAGAATLCQSGRAQRAKLIPCHSEWSEAESRNLWIALQETSQLPSTSQAEK